jgi:hypothetical protein
MSVKFCAYCGKSLNDAIICEPKCKSKLKHEPDNSKEFALFIERTADLAAERMAVVTNMFEELRPKLDEVAGLNISDIQHQLRLLVSRVERVVPAVLNQLSYIADHLSEYISKRIEAERPKPPRVRKKKAKRK